MSCRRRGAGLILPALILALAGDLGAQDLGEIVSQVTIGQGQGGFTGALAEGDEFGRRVADLGDVDGDGVRDLAVAVRNGELGNLVHEGAVWVLLMNEDGTVRENVRIGKGEGGFGGHLDEGDEFGSGLAPLGDLDGNGVPDLAVGARRDDDGGLDHGAVWILFLDQEGRVAAWQKISDTEGGFPGDLDDKDEFGGSLASLGMIDGAPALATGARRDDTGGVNHGAVWVLRLAPGGTVESTVKIADGEGGFDGVLRDQDQLGRSLTAVGDIDRNGTVDLAAGIRDANGGRVDDPARGALYVLLMAPDGGVLEQVRIASGEGGFVGPLAATDEFSSSLAALGDLDANGTPDLAVGASRDDTAGPNAGSVWLLFLKSDGTVDAERRITAPSGDDPGGPGEGFGTGLAPFGDGLAVGSAGVDGTAEGGAIDLGQLGVLGLQGAVEEIPFEPPVTEFDGRPGRPALVPERPTGAEDFIGEPVVATPRTTGNRVVVSTGSIAFEEGLGSGGLAFVIEGEFEVGDEPSAAAAGDFQSDVTAEGGGQLTLDIAVANEGGDSVSLLLAVPGPDYAPHVEFPLVGNGAPVALAVADFDDDGRDDVAVAGDMGVTVLLGDGLGGFSSQVLTPVSLLTDLAVGYVDGDADLDIVTASGKQLASPSDTEAGFATVLLGNGDGTFSSPGSFAPGFAVASVELGDVVGSADLDALVAVHQYDGGPFGQPQGVIDLYLGDGAGGFTPSGTFSGYETPSSEGIHPTFGALEDLNSDGFLDAVYTSSDNIARPPADFGDEQPPVVLTVLLNDTTGGFGVSEQGTAYVGKGVDPIPADVIPDGGAEDVDVILVWFTDEQAGSGGDPDFTTFITALGNTGDGTLVDPASNQANVGGEPGDGALVMGGVLVFGEGEVPQGPTIAVPNEETNSLQLVVTDGSGGIFDVIEVPDISKVTGDGEGKFSTTGGPRVARALDLDGDDFSDFVVYSQFEDTFGEGKSFTFASFSTVTTGFSPGEGGQGYFVDQEIFLNEAGDFEVADVTDDGDMDVLVAQSESCCGPNRLVLYRNSGGFFSDSPENFETFEDLSGGLLVADVVGDELPDVVTSARVFDEGKSQLGALLVWDGNTFVDDCGGKGCEDDEGGLFPQVYVLDASWDRVRSLVADDVDEDGIMDVLVGLSDGRLLLAAGGKGGFLLEDLDEQSATQGGGRLAMDDLDGDGRGDLVSSNTTEDFDVDQAFVRTLLGEDGASFDVSVLPGISATGSNGPLAPILGDVNDDGAVDTVLVHGTSGAVSILLNRLSGFEPYGLGKAGLAGVVPELSGKGYTTPGSTPTLAIRGVLADTVGVLQIGTGRNETGLELVQTVLASVPLTFRGGDEPGEGKFPGFAPLIELDLALPDELGLVGAEFTFQVLALDPFAGPPVPVNVSASNGLALEVVN